MKKYDCGNFKKHTEGLQKRDQYAALKDFIARGDGDKVMVLSGLRRSGKTTLAQQAVAEASAAGVPCAFYELDRHDTMDNLFAALDEELKAGTKAVVVDEATNAPDFIGKAAEAADYYARAHGMRLVFLGTDSLSFAFACADELTGRADVLRTTRVAFGEHCRVIGTKDIDDYIKYGGLMRRGADRAAVSSLDDAKKYCDSAVALNIADSLSKYDGYRDVESGLRGLTAEDFKRIINRLAEAFSGRINEKTVNKELASVSVNAARDYLRHEEKGLIQSIWDARKDITEEFAKRISADGGLSRPLSEKDVNLLIKYLLDMDALSKNRVRIIQTSLERRGEKHLVFGEYFITQPAIKYWHLIEGLKFVDEFPAFRSLSVEQKKTVKKKLRGQTLGALTEQVVLADTRSLLPEKYEVEKVMFQDGGESRGEYDMLVRDKEDFKYWAFEIKHTSEAFQGHKNGIYAGQDKYLADDALTGLISEAFGDKEHVCVLYNGEPFVGANGTAYINTADFLREVYRRRDMRAVMDALVAEAEKRTEAPSEPRFNDAKDGAETADGNRAKAARRNAGKARR